MRKVLLATTALVALNVSAASADISISGSASFDIDDNASGTTYTSDGNIVIKGSSTTDSGLTVSAVQDSTFEANAVADSYVDIAGDFGSIRMGKTDNALDRFDGVLPENMDIETAGASGVTTGPGDTTGISYISPAFNGITVYATAEANGSTSGFGANYKAGPIEVMFQSDDDGSEKETTVAGKFTAGPITVGIGAADYGTGSTKAEYRQIGATYTMGDIKFATVQLKKGSTKYSNVGAKYTVAPGLTISAESGTQGGNNATFLSVGVSF
jgi:hypothetical protein